MKIKQDIIPDRSHTFSKAHHQYPTGISPEYANSAKGSKLYTNKGEYTDWSMGLGPVIKGYAFEDLDKHINVILKKGIAYSLPSSYEFEVAKKLIDSLEFGEQVRFARNGSDATSAAVRLARHITGKDKIICNGYHGWQDWYIGTTTRNYGVPKEVSNLTIKIDAFSIESLELAFHNNKGIACLILEPMIGDEPNNDFLTLARELCNQNKTLLIFDECWTGFRCHKSGAIGYTGITPDLACYAKALGNGVPVSAVVGNKKLMSGFEEVFFSFTHASDPIGLAAADFMISYLDSNFFKALTSKTKEIHKQLNKIFSKIKKQEYLIIATSYPGKIVMSVQNPNFMIQLKTFLQKELLSRNILFNMFLAVAEDHSKNDINDLLAGLESAVEKINNPNFNLDKETENQLVKAVFREHK